MERKEPTRSEDLIYGMTSSWPSPHVGRGKGNDYEAGDYEGGDKRWRGNDYEVFLSFRGKDTRKGFTDHLYTMLVDVGIHVFRDDNELRVGEEIGPELLYSIKQSKISIPIISENYVSSKWCLRELAYMLKCKRNGGQIVLPIFYKVKPSQLRHLTGRFGDVINAHKKNLDEMVVKEWEEALKEVSLLKGWESEKIHSGHEGILVKEVVREVMSKLKKLFKLIVPTHVIGIDDHVEQIMSLIDAKFDGTSIVGIYGMGGIGKTTLARLLYNKLSSHFEYLSFVANIRETSRHKGIECLQKQLITDILGSLYDLSNVEEFAVIKSQFRRKKVLILLDDIDDNTQLSALCGDGSWFKAGSIVIITTRSKSILDEFRVGYMYQLRELSWDQSLILFSRHAFRKNSPQSGYEVISRDIVSTTGGLPLALEIIGSFLYGKTENVWKDTLKELKKVPYKKVPYKKVQDTLRISYEALDYEEKQIFLDIACFFIGSSKQSPTYMWDSFCFFPEMGIKVLSSMSLIKVDKDGKLTMHDQMRDMGREIVRLENQVEPQERSRLWINEEAMYVLDSNKGTSKIEALRLDKYSCRSYRAEQFKKLTNLRFLQVNGANFIGDFQNLLPQLRWLQWQACPSDFTAANFHLKKLVVLNLSCSGISEEWGGWGPLKMAIELQVLNLSHCHSLKRTPDLSAFKRLEILILEDCENLEEIHSSIGDIKTLVSLNVNRCLRLEELPAGIGRLEELRELLLDETAIQKIPISSGGLMKLETLRASFYGQRAELSKSVGSLVSLTHLDLSHSGIKELPESIGSLRELNTLDVSYCASLTCIPSSIGQLASLQHLLLRECCLLGDIPDSIGKLGSLTELDLKSTAIVELPESIGNLQNLRILDIRGTNVRKLPGAITMTAELQELRASHCKNLEGLPNNIGELVSLNNLDLEMSGISGLPESISKLSSLQNLSVQYCEKLRELPELPSGLTALDITCQTPLLPLLCQLTLLKKLTLSDCLWLICLPELPIGLMTLSITRCGKLKVLTLSKLEHLTTLILTECFDLTEVTGLEDLRCLSKLQVQQCPKIPRLDGLESLTCLHIEKSMEKMKDEARQRAADLETSDRNYAIAAVQNVVGIDDRVKQITDLLEMEVNDEVHIIGIYGTDGIGKTTLAKAAYKSISSCFDSCSFLAKVEETTQNPSGIQLLQTKLIHDILEQDREDPSFDERIEDFWDICRDMKVLIVVDDVQEQSHLRDIVGDQLHWFGPGSRIIVTSENKEILKEYGSEKARTYMVSKLDDGQAFELFCRHAFGMQSSIPDYDGLANRIVNATEKLPLAVEVIGSFLRSKSIQEWKKMEKSMKLFTTSSEKTTVGLEEILDICYKELDQQQKDIFLDIACFISGVDAQIASYMWSNCYLPSSGCILMPLAKTGENNELQMHRLLRCLGKRILNQEGSGDPIGRKFYIQDMVPKAISREKGMENVEALSFDFTAGDFQSMPDIRFLKLDNAKVSGNFEGAFASLRWLCWQRCPLDFGAENFVLKELIILDLSGSKVTKHWGGWGEIKMEKLKVLNLTGCSDLLITPDFSGYKDLEILILEGCSCLAKLDSSIGNLNRLVSLNLKFCSQLKRLPVELGRMTALKELFLDGTSVGQIPISIGNLKQLEILSGFKCFRLTHLPSSICDLTALSELSLDGAKITELPSSLGELLNLRRLSLRDCHYMKELPYSIGKMGSLEELDISATSISELPNSIGNLKSLRVLRMDSSFIRTIPGEIGNLTKLEELYASWCRSLKGAIPSDIGGLRHLRSLTLGHSSISSLPPKISAIPGLHTLDLIQCNEIEELPKLPPSLIHLRVSSKRMKAIPLLEDLTELEDLCLSDGDPKARGPPSKQPMPESNMKQMIDRPSFSISFPKLRKLELSLSQIIKLKFEPTDIPQLKTLTLSGLRLEEVSELPKTLSALSIQGCSSLKRLPTVQGSSNLSVFELYNSMIEEIEGLEGLKALKRLDISNCKIQNLNGIGQLTSLRSLILSDCDDLNLPDLSNLKSLKVLEIRQCKMIRQIEGIEQLTSLEKLIISKCPAENSEQVQNALKLVIRPVEKWGRGDLIKQGATSSKRDYIEEILLDTSNKRMKKMEDEAREQAADMEASDSNYAISNVEDEVGSDDRVEEITDLMEMEVSDERMEKMKDEAGPRSVDLETSDRNYAIAAVQNVVGIDDRAKQITDLLEMEVNDEVHIIGIYGIDGIGKTTLAKAVYKRISSCFDSCSFLAEVEETTQNPRGIQFLQTKLIRDILERDREDPSFDERIEDFLDIFRVRKVLIVVDDVEEPSYLHAIVGDQLHWFGPGSRIIVTSQNEEILKGYDPEKARTCTVSELDDGQAFELFCKHAFRMQSSIPDYDGLANRIVNATEKLPLAVEVVGSFLRGKSIQEWAKMEKSMELFTMSSQKTTVGLEEILDICYEALDPKQKDIFLDIAGFISGVDTRIASYMWPYFPSSGCILMPLAKAGENNELQMHRLLRCLGKRILNQVGSGDPIERKFCTQDMILKAISREKGMENVEVLSFDFTAGDFQSMPDIRFLKLDNAKVSRNFEGAFASLRWFCWRRCPLEFDAFNFVLRELVILDLSWSKVTEDWGGWSKIKMEKLKVLNLTGCSDLLLTPDFSGYKKLEILILERCSRLVKLDPSIGDLNRLVSLNLKSCSQLNGLPVELGCVTALKELFIDGTSIRQIPISIGNLKQLEILSGFKCFPLTHLPSSICYLTLLSELSLDGAKISELPSSLGNLPKLRRLSLRDCRYLEKLPYSIGEMGSLEELDILATSISELPVSIRNLKSLRVLRMDSSFIRAFPGEIGNLTKLEELHASWCRSLKGAIPNDIGGLRQLRSLTLGHSSISSLPPEISTIPGLHTLDLTQCNEIEELPKLPPSLIRLCVSSTRMKAIPPLEDLKELEELCLSDGDPKACRPPSAIEEIEGLEGLKALKRLDISNCKIRNLNGIGQLTSLRSLILSDCDDLSSLVLLNLKSLKVLEIRQCKMIHQIEGIEKLTSLKKLKISECPAENSEQVQNALKDVRARSPVM